MKIGILTLHLHTNYGGILQAYALQTTLERMGHEVVVLELHRKKNKIPVLKASFMIAKRCVYKYLLNKPCHIFYEKYINRLLPITAQHTGAFIKQYIHQNIYNTLLDIKDTEFDAIVVGSDQIWRPKYYHNIENAYLDFTKGWNIKRIAYASSFGTEKWEYTPEQTQKCKEAIQVFNSISVREDSAITLCKEYFNIDAKHVLDPTMLLHVEDYMQLVQKAKITKNKGSLFNYILDETPQKTKIINAIAKDKKLNPFRVNSKEGNIIIPIEDRIQQPVEAWLYAFYNASFIVTDSFHACVFSILFNKPFVVIGNIERGMSRFHSLLTMFDLQERMIESFDDYKKLTNINYSAVMKKLSEYRKTSNDYLTQSLIKNRFS